MKRFFLGFGFLISTVSFLSAQMGQVGQRAGGQMGPAGQTMGGISRAEIEQVLNSDDFKNLSKMMGIPIETMSDAEKNALIEETEQFAHQMEQLPPQEQEKKMQEIFSQITEQPQPPVEPKKPVEPQKAEKKQEKELPKVSHHKVESNKKITRKLAENLEKVELKFSSMLQASPDTLLEHDWAGITINLPWTISALRRMSNNDKLLEHLSSDEFRVLEGQISDTYKELKPLNKKFKTPDVAKLRQVAGVDASRAQLVNDEEKEISKKAATGIIKLLSGNIPSVKFGIKGMLERYDKAALAELEKLSKQPKPATMPEKKGSMYRADSSHGAGRGSSSYPSSSYYDPYERSYGGYQEPYGANDHGSSDRGSGAGRSGSGDSLYGPAGKDKSKDEKTGTAGDKKDKLGAGTAAETEMGKDKTSKFNDKNEMPLKDFADAADTLEKEAIELLKHTAVIRDPNTVTNAQSEPVVEKIYKLTAETILEDMRTSARKYSDQFEKTPDMREKAKEKLSKVLEDKPKTKELITAAQTGSTVATAGANPLATRLHNGLKSLIDGYNTVKTYAQTTQKRRAALTAEATEIDGKIDAQNFAANVDTIIGDVRTFFEKIKALEYEAKIDLKELRTPLKTKLRRKNLSQAQKETVAALE